MITKALLLTFIIVSVCEGLPTTGHNHVEVRQSFRNGRETFAGGVYAMSNNLENNMIFAYGRLSDGKIKLIGEFKTGGQGAILDNNDGIDPLFSAYSVILTPDHRFLLAVNAGSNSVSAFKIKADRSLELISERSVSAFGPLSIAFRNGLVYVASADANGESTGLSDQRGSLSGFRLLPSGRLLPLSGSERTLLNRPSAIQFSPDGKSLVVSSFFAGLPGLNNSRVNQIVVYRVMKDGRLTATEVSSTSSTKQNNPEGRNLPSSIGFQIERIGKQQILTVAEARAQDPTGEFGPLQTSSISTWRLTRRGQLIPIQLDTLAGSSVTEGQEATCWMVFSKTREYFWVSNTVSSTISSFDFNGGRTGLVEEIAGSGGESPVDVSISADGKYIYQLFAGSVGVFEVENGGMGPGLDLIQSVSGIPDQNAQGIVAF